MIRAIVFDLYGVLAVNGWQAFKETHFSNREDVWDQVYQLGRQVDAGLTDYNELVRFTADATGESEATVRHQLEHTVANLELLNFIQISLKGAYKLGILSNTSRVEVIDHIFTAEQRELFDVIILSSQLGITKPDPRIFEITANKLGVPIEHCLLVDDQERHIDGAHRASMQATMYTSTDQFKLELTALLADS